MEMKPVDVSNCTDNELIELAAVAIGYDGFHSWTDRDSYVSYSGKMFNPLTDWNAAMLLVTELGLSCSTGELFMASADLAIDDEYIVGDSSYFVFTEVDYLKSQHASDVALRRAITMLAAKIGKIKLETKN